MAARTFSPSGVPILMTEKPISLPACSANFHSVWNQGSSGIFTRNPILTWAMRLPAKQAARVGTINRLRIVFQCMGFSSR